MEEQRSKFHKFKLYRTNEDDPITYCLINMDKIMSVIELDYENCLLSKRIKHLRVYILFNSREKYYLDIDEDLSEFEKLLL